MTGQRASGDAAPALETLLDDAERFEAALDGTTEGPLAVVGDPFAGRELVLDRAAERLDATRVRLGPGDGAGPVREAVGDGPVVVDGCQHLYRRVVGGFEPVEAFLGLLARVEDLVVAGWNRYAWAYLVLVRELDRAFGTRVDVGGVAADRLAELLLARYDSVPAFVADETDRDGPVTVRRSELSVGGWTLSVPVPGLDLAALRARRADATPAPRDVVFERLAAAADGNVGVAAALWEASRSDTVRPSDVAVPDADLSLDRDENFCLRVLLAKERVERAELAALVDGDLDRILGRLRRSGLATASDGVVSLDPAGLPVAAASTDRSRIL